ncbi:hypothetical protein CYMTET_20876 [Cymbomonas tetramitiformis]|uniref:Uncharacterized protein n=1 Tax=Cymbomonas tetramitiformis TaxID=36881 RepID=A0AAE0G3N5_9CHLO|nr:hypothetical protein CYMTET_20876 [Cymbomonas tetramitiformis]
MDPAVQKELQAHVNKKVDQWLATSRRKVSIELKAFIKKLLQEDGTWATPKADAPRRMQSQGEEDLGGWCLGDRRSTWGETGRMAQEDGAWSAWGETGERWNRVAGSVGARETGGRWLGMGDSGRMTQEDGKSGCYETGEDGLKRMEKAWDGAGARRAGGDGPGGWCVGALGETGEMAQEDGAVLWVTGEDGPGGWEDDPGGWRDLGDHTWVRGRAAQVDPRQRITASAALADSWICGIPFAMASGGPGPRRSKSSGGTRSPKWITNHEFAPQQDEGDTIAPEQGAWCGFKGCFGLQRSAHPGSPHCL